MSYLDATGLAPNEKRPTLLQISPGSNLSWPVEDRNISYFIPAGKNIQVPHIIFKYTKLYKFVIEYVSIESLKLKNYNETFTKL